VLIRKISSSLVFEGVVKSSALIKPLALLEVCS